MSDNDDYDELERLLAGLDEPIGDSPDQTIQEDRNPVLTAASAGGKSAFGRLFPRGRRDEVILKALPDQYSQANENMRDIKYSARDLYSHTKEELVATERVLQRKASMLAPRIRKFMPGKLGDKFEAWANEGNEQWQWNNEQDRREQEISSMVDSAFRPQEQMVSAPPMPSKSDVEAAENAEATEKATDEIRQYTADIRQQHMEESLANIQQYIERITMSQHSIMGWRRKTLEIGIRQLFLTTDLVDIIKSANDRVIPAVEAIVKNTALPDYAKETGVEVAKAMAQRNMLEALGPGEWAKDFLKDFTTKAKDRISNLGGEIRSAMEFADMAADDGFGEEQELTPEQQRQQMIERGGSVAGDFIANKFIMPYRNKALAKAKEFTSKNERVSEMGEKLKYLSGNISSIYNTELTDETEDSFLKSIVSFLSETKEGFDGERVGLKARTDDWFNSPMVADNRLYVTQTEIIPAYLRSIDSAVWKLNGEERDNMYDMTTRGFVSSDDFAKQVRKQVGQSTKKELYDGGLDQLVNEFDSEGELSDEGRAELKEFFNERIMKNRTFDIKELSSLDNFNEVLTDMDDNLVFEQKLEEMAEEGLYKNMNKYADRFKRLRNLAGGYQEEINRIGLLHGDKALVDAGVFERTEYGTLEADKDLMNPEVRFEDKVRKGAESTADSVVRQFANANNATGPSMAPSMPSGEVNVEANVDFGTLESGISNVESAIHGISPLDRLDQLIEAQREGRGDILSIIEILRDLKAKGIPTARVEGEEGDESSDGKKGGWLSGAKRRARSMASLGGKVLGGGFKTGKSALGIGGGFAMGAAKRLLGGAKDVYDENGTKILSGAKLKAGEYWMKVDGKLQKITKLEDIKGAVFDKNGNEILGEEELENAGKLRFMSKGRWRPLSDAIGKGIKFGVKGTAQFGFNRLLNARDLGKRAIGFMTDLPDVYVAGEDKPRLRAELLKKGIYFCGGKVIKKLKDINGEVTDADGRVIISEEEFNSPEFKMTDQKGNDVKSRLGKVRARIAKNIANSRAMLKRVLGVGVKAGKGVLGAGVGAGKWAGGKAASLMGFKSKEKEEETPEEAAQRKEGIFSKLFGKSDKPSKGKDYDVLVKIYNLLNKRLPGEPEESIAERTKAFTAGNIKNPFSRVKEAAKKKAEDIGGTETGTATKEKFKRGMDKAKDSVSEPKRRYARMKGNRVKRNISEQLKRNRRAASIKAKRAKRDFGKEREENGVFRSTVNVAKKRLIPGAGDLNAARFIKRKADEYRAKREDAKMQGNANPPASATTKKEAPKEDQQLKLLQKIAQFTEGNFVRGMGDDAAKLGRPGLRQRMLMKFSKRLEGGRSQIFRQLAMAKDWGTGKLGALKNRLLKKGKGKKDKDDDDGGIASTIMTVLGGLGGVLNTGLSTILGGLAAKLGMPSLSSIGSTILQGGKTALQKGAGWLGRTLATNGARMAATSAATTAASAATSTVAATAAGGAASAGILSTAATVAGSILTGVGAVLTSPVTLTVAAVAAVAGIGYLAYKMATKKDPSLPGQLRFAQYGNHEYEDWEEDESIKLLYLEGELKKYLKMGPQGASIQGLTSEVAGKLALGYGCEEGNETELVAFMSWMKNRFIPIYLMWETRLVELNISGGVVGLEDAKIDYKTQKELVNKTRLQPDHPIFTARADPSLADRGWFMATTDFVGITDNTMMTGEEVADVTARILEKLEELVKEEAEKEKAKKKEDKKAEAKKRTEEKKKEVAETARKAMVDAGGEEAPMQSNLAQRAYEAMFGDKSKTKLPGYGNFEQAKRQKEDAQEKGATIESPVKPEVKPGSAEHPEVQKIKTRKKIVKGSTIPEHIPTLGDRGGINIREEVIEPEVKKEKVVVGVIKTANPGSLTKAEIGRFALYGLAGFDTDTAATMREIERLVVEHVDVKSGEVDLSVYNKALPHIMQLGDMSKEEYGGEHELLMKTWLRERVIPMYLVWTRTLSNIVGAGAVMNPEINEKVFKAMIAMGEVEQHYGPRLRKIITQPAVLDWVGDFDLMKKGYWIAKEFEKIKPKKKVKLSAEDQKPTAKPAPQKKKEETEGKKPLTPTEQRKKELDELRAKLMPTVDKLAKEKEAAKPNVSMQNVRDVVVDKENTGSAEYSQFSNVQLRSTEDVALLIGKIAEAQGMDPDLLITTAMVESNLNPKARPPKGSAAGLFQFIKRTWKEQMDKHANRLGIPQGTQPTDPVAATLLASEYFRQNAKALPGDKHSVVDLYMTHFLGGGGASKFQRGFQANPNTPAVKAFSREAGNNPNVFYHRNGRAKSYMEIYQDFTKKFVARSSHVRSVTRGAYGGSVFKEAANDIMAKEANRERVVENKAKVDAAAPSPISSEAYRAVAPGGKKMPVSSTTSAASTDTPDTKPESTAAPAETKGSGAPVVELRPADATTITEVTSPEPTVTPTETKPVETQQAPANEVASPSVDAEPTGKVAKKTKEFKEANPNATETDVEQYQRALTEAYSKPTQAEGRQEKGQVINLDRLIKAGKDNSDAAVKVLNSQLKAQQQMVTLLSHMDNKLAQVVALNGTGTREMRQQQLDEIKEKKAMGLPVDLSSRQVNVSRNKSA